MAFRRVTECPPQDEYLILYRDGPWSAPSSAVLLAMVGKRVETIRPDLALHPT